MKVNEDDEDLKNRCESIAEVIKEKKFKNAVETAALELFCRMIVGDYPPHKPR